MTMNTTFDPQTLADDLDEVGRIYARFFSALDDASWDKPVKGGPKEWTLHETVAHLCALNGDGLESIKHALHGEPYTFRGLDSRYEFNAFNRKGIDEHLAIPKEALCARLLEILDEAARIARSLRPDQAELTMQMPIYNRPVRMVEALSIICVHTGLFHSAQVAEPPGLPPLWRQLSPEVRHRMVGRTMRAFSLLYRRDIGGSLRTTFVFRVAGPGGGEWYVDLAPEAATSGEGVVAHPGLVIQLARHRRLLPDADLPPEPADVVAQRRPETARRPASVPAHEHSVQCGCQTASRCSEAITSGVRCSNRGLRCEKS